MNCLSLNEQTASTNNRSRHRHRPIQNECAQLIQNQFLIERKRTTYYLWTYALTSNVCLFECPFSYYAVINAMAIYQTFKPTSHMYWHLMILYLVYLDLLKICLESHKPVLQKSHHDEPDIGSNPTNNKKQQHHHHHHHQMNENASPRLSSQIVFSCSILTSAFCVPFAASLNCICNVFACSNHPFINACSGVNTIYQFRLLYLDT